MENKRYITNEAGACPKCGKIIENWGDMDIDGDYCAYTWDCSCGAYGREYYRLVFDGHSVYNEEIEDWDNINDYLNPVE
jgi:hypothetical protein